MNRLTDSWWGLILVGVLGLSLLAGCGGGEQPAPEQEAAPTETAAFGSLLLTATYEDTPPQRTRVDATGNPECQQDTILGEKIVVNDDGTLRDVVASVKSGPSGYEKEAEEVVIDQYHCRYDPHVVTVKAGQTVIVTDSDPQMHNVRASQDGKQLFSMTTFEGDRKEVSFDNPGLVYLECNIHPWMEAWVYVTDHGAAEVTGTDGEAALSDLPTGDYSIETWHEKFGERTHETSVEEDQQTTVEESYCCAD